MQQTLVLKPDRPIIGYLEETDLEAIKLNNNRWSDRQCTY
jgi:hypothetical protein